MADNVYECLFIFDANAYARDPSKASETVEKIITSFDGELLASRLWNEQKLAYPIKGRHKGAYWLSYFRLKSDQVTALNRAFQLTDNILRHLVIKVEPRLVETLVAAAKGETQAAPEVAEEEPVAAEPVADEAATVAD